MTAADICTGNDILTGNFDSMRDLSDYWAEIIEIPGEDDTARKERRHACIAYFDHVDGETSPFNPDEKERAVADPILKGVMIDDYSGVKRVHGREWCIRVFGAETVARIEAAQYNAVNEDRDCEDGRADDARDARKDY